MHQLKNFNPSHPDRYDEEVQEYQQHLERTYRLCRYCKIFQIVKLKTSKDVFVHLQILKTTRSKTKKKLIGVTFKYIYQFF